MPRAGARAPKEFEVARCERHRTASPVGCRSPVWGSFVELYVANHLSASFKRRAASLVLSCPGRGASARPTDRQTRGSSARGLLDVERSWDVSRRRLDTVAFPNASISLWNSLSSEERKALVGGGSGKPIQAYSSAPGAPDDWMYKFHHGTLHLLGTVYPRRAEIIGCRRSFLDARRAEIERFLLVQF